MKWKGISALGATAIFWAITASSVLARGGGGRSGTFSAPRSGGGFSSGLGGRYSGGGLGGGLFGGGFFYPRSFFPFPFFFGGGGFFTLLVLAVIVFVVFRMVIRRSFNRDLGDSGGGAWGSGNYQDSNQPVDFEGRPIRNDRSRFGKAINFTRQNIDYYAQKFPRWDYGVLTGRVREVFFFLQEAWSRQDLSGGTEYFTPELLADYQSKLDAMRSRGERNVVRDPDLNAENIDFVYSALDAGGERFAARIFASLYDYNVDSQGRVISGDEHNRLYFSEFWEFVWQDNRWKLAAIHQEDSLEAARWARVDEL